MTEIWLIRHGQTDWNVAGLFQGHTDIPLNATGKAQAQAVTPLLEGVKFDAIFSSDLKRAYETAEILAAHLKLPITVDRRLREINQGEWEGLTLKQVQANYQFDPTRDNDTPEASRAPGGESALEVAARMSAAADEIAHRYPHGRVLLVSHGFSVAVLYCLANGYSLRAVHDYIPENVSRLIIHWPKSM